MSDGIELFQNEDGTWSKMPDYQLTICFDTEEQMNKFIEKQKRYRWHSLRKDPEDTPDKMEGLFGNEFFEVVQEDNEDAIPRASYQYDSESGFGWWNDIYDPVTLGFVDSEFHSLKDEGLADVVAWRLVEPYEEDE